MFIIYIIRFYIEWIYYTLTGKITPYIIPHDTLYCYENGKMCKYYRYYDKTTQGCLFEGFVGIDFCLYDQCKMCYENFPEIKGDTNE